MAHAGSNVDHDNAEISLDDAETVELAPKHEHDDEMDMTAMIDITFLLLIFFVVTSKLSNEVKQPLPAARNGQLVASDKKHTIIFGLRRGGGDTAVVFKDDGKPFSDDPEQQSAEIEEYIQIGLNQQKSEILIRADGDVRNGDVNRLKEIVSPFLEDGQLISFGVLHEEN